MPYRGGGGHLQLTPPREIFVPIEGDRGPTRFKSHFSKFLSAIARIF